MIHDRNKKLSAFLLKVKTKNDHQSFHQKIHLLYFSYYFPRISFLCFFQSGWIIVIFFLYRTSMKYVITYKKRITFWQHIWTCYLRLPWFIYHRDYWKIVLVWLLYLQVLTLQRLSQKQLLTGKALDTPIIKGWRIKSKKKTEIRVSNHWICRGQSLLWCCCVSPSRLSDLESKDDWTAHQDQEATDTLTVITVRKRA